MNASTRSIELDLKNLFPFELDPFQKQAIAALNADRSVVVCAPTGSGKTLIGEYAIYRALARGGRVFYTTPLKALSNQKLRDFRSAFGIEQVGLVTGDVCINRDALILVMTTEIFRNMLYGTPIGEIGTSLEGVEAVVLDECHYMNDRQRGTVWEESIIYCPPQIQLIALSATVANADQLTDWLNLVHGSTELVYSNFRPVPLQFNFGNPKGLFPLLDKSQTQINSFLKPKKGWEKNVRGNRYDHQQKGGSLIAAIKQIQQKDEFPHLYFMFSRRGCEEALTELGKLCLVNSAEATQIRTQAEEFLAQNPQVGRNDKVRPMLEPLCRGFGAYHLELQPSWRNLIAHLFQQGLVKVLFVPQILYVVSQLQRRDMLPAIYFIFSRSGCDLAVMESDRAVAELGAFSLVNETEAKQLRIQIDQFVARNPEVARVGQIEPLYRGIAAHHAGLLPAWKGFVEELFQQGLVKVVFATETLAAGINMPARTTVISALSKRTDDGHRLLTPSEFLQMAGRAGRRGMDVTGYVVTLQTPFEGAKEAAYLATSGADPLVSQFTPTYGMVLNLLQTHSLIEAKDLVERSFAQYLATLYLKPQQQAITELTAELTKLDIQLAPIDLDALANYQKLKERLKQEHQLLKTLQQQAEAVQASDIAQIIPYVPPGTLLSLKGKYIQVPSPVPAVLIAKEKGRGQSPYLVCLSAENRWFVATTHDLVELHGEALQAQMLESVVPPVELTLKPGQVRRGTPETEAIASQIPPTVELTVAPEVLAQEQVVESVTNQLENHAIRQWGNPSQLLKRHRRRLALQDEINQRQAQFRENQAQHWQEFLNLIEILRAFGCLEDVTPTLLGQAAAAIRGDNELWLGLALMSGEFDELDPHHLAAAACALVTETPRPDSWTNYSPPEPAFEALKSLRGMRRQLFQLQRRYHVALPVWLEYDLIGIPEQWALGVEWTQLCANTSLDEGDIVRILRRTIDLLSQLPHVPPLPDTIKRNAIRAIQLMDRFPVNEVVA
ncbi:MAG TPA: DEAD/DEAH box helicase [Cyanobacteria bacterium UBA9273]|nr:DEAD/DEAH box helicase [Cyanobacteria bacterium UBA9273]